MPAGPLRLIILPLLLAVASMAKAATVSSVQDISFGSIDLHPGGDTVTIAASSGPGSPISTQSMVIGGSSGRITISSQTVEHVDIIYPPTVTLQNGVHTITVDNLDNNSQYSVGGTDTLGNGIPLQINVGGRLSIPSGQAQGAYSGPMTITLNFS